MMMNLIKKTLTILSFFVIFSDTAHGAVRFIMDEAYDIPYTSPTINKKCEDYGLVSSIPNGESCLPIIKDGKKCYSNCERRIVSSCEEANYSNYVPIDEICTEVKIGDRTCYKDCTSFCGRFNLLPRQVENKKCDAVVKEGVTCYKNCKNYTCADLELLDRSIANKKCIEMKHLDLTCYKCTDFEEICNSGGYLHYVPVNESCTETTYNSTTCYKDCAPISCSSVGYHDSEQENKICYRKVINENYNNCYECRDYRCSDGGYSGVPISGKSCGKVSYKALTCYDLSTCS